MGFMPTEFIPRQKKERSVHGHRYLYVWFPIQVAFLGNHTKYDLLLAFG